MLASRYARPLDSPECCVSADASCSTAHVPSVLSFCRVSHQALSSGRRALYRRPFLYHCAGNSDHPWPSNNSLLSALEDPEIGSLVRSTSGIEVRFRVLRSWQTKHQREVTDVTNWYHRALQACPLLTQAEIIFSTVDDFSYVLNALSLLPHTSLDHAEHPTSSITSISLEFIPDHSKVVDCQKAFELLSRSSITSLVNIFCSDIGWLDQNSSSSSGRFPFSPRELFVETTQSSHLVNCSQLFPHTPYALEEFDFHSSDTSGGCDLSVLPTLLDPSLRKLALSFGGHFSFNVPLSHYFSSTPGPRLALEIFLSYPLLTSLSLFDTHGPSLRLLETLAKSAPLLYELSLTGSRWISDSNILSPSPADIFPEPLILAALLKFARLTKLDLGTLPTSDPFQHSDLKTKLEAQGMKVRYDICREG